MVAKENFLMLLLGSKYLLYVMFIFIVIKILKHHEFSKRVMTTRIALAQNSSDFIRYMEGHSRLSPYLLKAHIRFIEQTNIRKYNSHASLKMLLLILLFLFHFVSVFMFAKTGALLMSLSLGVISMFIPLIILDALKHYNLQRIRGDIVHFLSLLGQWYVVTEDIMKSFEKICNQHLSEPLGTYIEDFVTQVKRGLDISEALYILDRKVDSEFFSTFTVNIDQALSNRGDVGIMLKNLEDEAYQLQEELNRRNISSFHDKIIIYITMLLVIIIGYQFLLLNEVTEKFYFETAIGRALIVVYCILYLLGFLIATGLSKMEY